MEGECSAATCLGRAAADEAELWGFYFPSPEYWGGSKRGIDIKNPRRLLGSSRGRVVVRLIGLEPTRHKPPDPKSGASTNFATGAECAAGEGGGTDMETTVQPKPS